jgi:ATP-dependent Lhr-like helicase
MAQSNQHPATQGYQSSAAAVQDEGVAARNSTSSIENRASAIASSNSQTDRESAVEVFARALLYRYGVVFRRLLEREIFNVSWYELGRVYRRLEARGEIRGGHFVSGVSGEQFAFPEAIGSLRSIRKQPAKGELIAISGADPLNLEGILSPGPRISAIASNRILLRDGIPIAALESGNVLNLESRDAPLEAVTERALRIGKLPPELRRYYAR